MKRNQLQPSNLPTFHPKKDDYIWKLKRNGDCEKEDQSDWTCDIGKMMKMTKNAIIHEKTNQI